MKTRVREYINSSFLSNGHYCLPCSPLRPVLHYTSVINRCEGFGFDKVILTFEPFGRNATAAYFVQPLIPPSVIVYERALPEWFRKFVAMLVYCLILSVQRIYKK